MKCTFDDLYEVFEDYLYEKILEEESEDTFVANVVNLYMRTIRKKTGAMPQAFLEDIKEDTAEVVYDMLLKRTYGYFNLNDFRKSLREKDLK